MKEVKWEAAKRILKKLCKGAVIKKGLAVRGGSVAQAEKEIEKWVLEEK